MVPNVGFQTGRVSLQVDALKITLLRDLETLKIDSGFIFLLLVISKWLKKSILWHHIVKSESQASSSLTKEWHSLKNSHHYHVSLLFRSSTLEIKKNNFLATTYDYRLIFLI